jgi:CRP/FNR family transcriptional regulator, anaerobic regulatory protein
MAIALATRGEISQPRAAAHQAARPAYLRPVPPAREPDSLESVLHPFGTSVGLNPGRHVAEQGDSATHIFRVEQGVLRVVRQLADGRRCVVRFLKAGDYFGLAESGTYKSSVEAVTEAHVVRYQRSALDRLCENDIHASRHIVALVSRQLSAAQDSLVLIGQTSALERIAAFLLAMAESGNDENSVVKLPMDRCDIADYLGIRFETVSRILTALRRRKVIDLPDFHSFVILDRDALESMAQSED